MKIKSFGKIKHNTLIKHSRNVSLCDNCIDIVKRTVSMTLRYEQVDVPCVVSVLITDDEGIRNYNYEYRGIDKSTDVLSFPMQIFKKAGWRGVKNPEFDEKTGELPLGDIIISIDTIKKHAIEYGNTVEHETTYMLIHSALHLLGYAHTDENNEKTMHKKSKSIIHYLQGSGEEYYI